MKFIRKCIVFIIVSIVLVVSLYMFVCHRIYNEYSEQASIPYLVEKVESKNTFVPYENLPDSLVKATIAIEDRRFYSHNGVDMIGLARAIVSQVDDDFLKSGGSTITQQTAKNLYGMYDQSFFNKGVQMWMAWELEKNYSKDEIIAIYVNIINYGDLNDGIYEASVNYFGVYPYDLSIQQASILAGIPNLPSYYQLSNHYDNARTRQYNVLVCMADCGYINESDIEWIYNQPIY